MIDQNGEVQSPMEQVVQLRNKLTQTYQEIDSRARQLIQDGKVVANPILTGKKKDTRYSVVACGFINGPADTFLGQATTMLAKVEPTAHFNPDGFRHMLFREMFFESDGRLASGIDAKMVRKYYQALRSKFAQGGKPIKLELAQVLPAVDKEQDSISLVGAFLPVDDMRIVDIRREVHEATEAAKLQSSSRLGEVRVLFSTLGRLVNLPENGQELINTIDEINKNIPPNCQAEINKMEVLSTTPVNYVWVDRHVYMAPSISLNAPNPPVDKPYFIKASQRKAT